MSCGDLRIALSLCLLLGFGAAGTSYAALEETPARIEATELKAQAAQEGSTVDLLQADEAEETEREDFSGSGLVTGIAIHQALLADSAFLSARNAFQKKHAEALDELARQTLRHPLHGYVELWQLVLRLRNRPDDVSVHHALNDFITRHEDEYLAERARGEWARVAAECGDRAFFNRLWVKLSWQKTEPDLQNLYALMRLTQQPTAKTLREAKLLLAETKMPQADTSKRLADAVLARDPKWHWQYLLVLLQKNRFKQAAALVRLSPAHALPVRASQIEPVLVRPEHWFKTHRKRLNRVPAKLLVVAALRFATSDSATAARLASAASSRLDAGTRALLWGRIAHMAALNHDPKTLSYYHRAGSRLGKAEGVVMPEAVLAWQVRTHLRLLDWRGLLRSLAKLPAAQARQPVWTYWKARALSATRRTSNAQQLFQSLRNDSSFYGLLACDALNVPYAKGFQRLTPPLEASQEVRFIANPHLNRALRFYELDLIYEGNREWNWALRSMTTRDRLELAEHAKKLGLTHRAINTLASTGVLVRDLAYPRVHAQAIAQAARMSGLSENLLYGLIRQESRFVTNAKSSVGALGLMQVMPRTARWVAKKVALKTYTDQALTRLDTNLLIGAHYLKLVKDSFEGSIPLSCASYNAGPSRAQSWRSRLVVPVEGAIFAETIPFTETREYVKHVTANTTQYCLGTPEEQRLTQILGRIEPRPNTAIALP